jgi:hypothetical protein
MQRPPEPPCGVATVCGCATKVVGEGVAALAAPLVAFVPAVAVVIGVADDDGLRLPEPDPDKSDVPELLQAAASTKRVVPTSIALFHSIAISLTVVSLSGLGLACTDPHLHNPEEHACQR